MRHPTCHTRNIFAILLAWLTIFVTFPADVSATILSHPPTVSVWEMLFGPPPPGQRHATVPKVGPGTWHAAGSPRSAASAGAAPTSFSPSAALNAPGNACDPAASHSLDASTEDEVLKNLLCPFLDHHEVAVVPPHQPQAAPIPLQDTPAQTTASPAGAGTVTPIIMQALLAAKPVPPAGAAPLSRLFVSTSPEDATVRLLHHPAVFSQGMALEPGAYVIEARRAGHAPARQEVIIHAGQDTASHLTLAPAPTQGQLFVHTRPAGATVRVVNIKPVFSQGMHLAPGTYQLDAFLDGYRTAVTNVTIAAGEQQSVTIDLEPAGPQGRLFVQTEPAGAHVRILTIQPRFRQGMLLEEGSYTVQATLAGHDPVTVEAHVHPDKDNTLTLTLPRTAPDGQLFVDGLPAGGTVRVMTVRPLFAQGMALRPGPHTVELTVPGQHPVRHLVTVLSGEAVRVNAVAVLEANRGSIAPRSAMHGNTAPPLPLLASPPPAPNASGSGITTGPGPAAASDVVPDTVLGSVTAITGGRLFVLTAPSGADIRILHVTWSAPAIYAEGMLLPEGLYSVSAFKDGYDPALERVQVLAGKNTRLYLDLAAKQHESAAAMLPRRPGVR